MITVRPAHEDDKPQILALISKAFGADQASREEKLWHWRWDLNPHLSPKGYQGLVADWNGELIGTTSALPAGLLVEGKPVDASWFLSLMVDAGAYRKALREERSSGRDDGGVDRAQSRKRRQGIASQMFAHGVARGPLLGRHFSDAVLVVMKKDGFKDLADTRYLIRNLSFTPRIARFLGRWIAPLVGIIPNLVIGRSPRPSGRITRFEGGFDESFDELWQRAGKTYRAVTRRDAEVLQWRYRQRPDADYVVLVAREGGQLQGYAILRTFERRRCLRGRIVDLFTSADDEPTRRDLLCAALSALRKMKADRVACYSSDKSMEKTLTGLGFARAKYAAPTSALGFPVPNFFTTMGDGDGD